MLICTDNQISLRAHAHTTQTQVLPIIHPIPENDSGVQSRLNPGSKTSMLNRHRRLQLLGPGPSTTDSQALSTPSCTSLVTTNVNHFTLMRDMAMIILGMIKMVVPIHALHQYLLHLDVVMERNIAHRLLTVTSMILEIHVRAVQSLKAEAEVSPASGKFETNISIRRNMVWAMALLAL